MKVNYFNSYQLDRRGQGQRTIFSVSIVPENEAEKAILRLCRSSQKRQVSISSDGSVDVEIIMPRGKYTQ